MLLRNIIVTVFLSYMVTGQSQDFEQECHILKILDDLEDRLQKQETLTEQQATRLQHQEALLGNQTDQLKYQEALLGNQTDQLKYQEALLGNQTDQLKYQEALLGNQTDQLKYQAALLGNQTDQLKYQEALLGNQTDQLKYQEALLGNQTDQLNNQEALLGNQTDQLKYQEALLGNQTDQLKYQAALLENQTALLQQQQTLLEQQTARLREQEAEISALQHPKTDCGVLYDNGITQSGVYVISPGGGLPFDVYCDMTDNGWTVMQRRIDGTVSFNRTWDEYVRGFGDVNGEYWLGLEKIYRLTKDGAEIYFDMENYDGTRDYAHYKSFTVHDATTLYKMNVDAAGYNGSIDELFSWHDDMKFSTYDRDNDDSSLNCAQYWGGGGGWWFKSCCLLGYFNGVFGKQDDSGIRYVNNGYNYVKTVTIKLRQRP